MAEAAVEDPVHARPVSCVVVVLREPRRRVVMRHLSKENNQPARGNMTSGFVILTKLSPEFGGRVAILADDIRLVEEVHVRKVESLERPGEFEHTTEHCQVVAVDSDGKKITVYVRDSFDEVMRSWCMARNERVIPTRGGVGP